ncbi:MAG: DMT family transporter [Dolichospermum sp.]
MSHLSSPSGFSRWKIFVYGISAAASWGFSTVMTKGLLEYIPPLTLLVIQLISSNVFLWVIIWLRKIPIPPARRGIKLGLPGLLQPGIANTLGIIGLSLTDASVESLIWSTETILIIVFAWLLLGEKVSFIVSVFSFIAFFGVCLVTVNFNSTVNGSSSVLGNLLIVVATFCATLYTIIIRRLVVNLDSLILVALNQSVGLVGVSLVWLFSQLMSSNTELKDISFGIWTLAVISGITLHGLPFWLHTFVLKNVQASFASLFITLIPVFTIIGSHLFLDEKLSSIQWVGTALILVSVVSVSFLYKE